MLLDRAKRRLVVADWLCPVVFIALAVTNHLAASADHRNLVGDRAAAAMAVRTERWLVVAFRNFKFIRVAGPVIASLGMTDT
jgi:hypothetical protein